MLLREKNKKMVKLLGRPKRKINETNKIARIQMLATVYQ